MRSWLRTAILAGSLAACTDSPTLPPMAAPHLITGGVTAAQNTIDSRETFSMTFDSVKVRVGSSRTLPSDTLTYRYETIVKMTATGTIVGFSPMNIREFMAAYPSGQAVYRPGGDISVTTFDGSTGTVISFPGAGDPAVTYVRLPALTKISGGSRSNKTLWYPNNPHCTFGSPTSPYPCPAEDYRFCDGFESEACVNYGGAAGSVLVERLAASMIVTVDSGGAPLMTGSSVVIKVRASTDSVTGFVTPVVIDTAGWTPDPDSTGGDYIETKITGACTVTTVAAGGKNCTRTMVGSGTIRIVAHINGKGYEATQHLGVSDGFPILTPPQASVFPFAPPTTDSTRFTATMSDGSAVNIVYPRWVFIADVGAGTTSFACAFPTRNPCAVAVRDNGYMSVTVLYKGVEKHARARVNLRNRFELTAYPNEVGVGRIARFTPTYNGLPTTAARWRWAPDSASSDTLAGCVGGVTKCYRVMRSTGTMWAYTSSGTGGDSAKARIIVTDTVGCSSSAIRPGGSRATLSCGGEEAPQDSLAAELGPIASDVATLVNAKPFALLNVPCDQIPAWVGLANLAIPSAVITRLTTEPALITPFGGPSWIQKMQNAFGPVVSLDYYAVKVPIANIPNGLTVEGYLNFVRTHINDFIDDPVTFEFYPGLVDEDQRWLTTPLTTVFSIHLAPWNSQDGSVVTTQYTADHWVFSTVWTPADQYHPVSGNRQFGAIDNGDGTATFYTRGVDRISTSVFTGLDALGLDVYEHGGAAWVSLQNNLKNNLGVSAVIQAPIIYRPKYAEISAVFSGFAPVSTLDGCGTP